MQQKRRTLQNAINLLAVAGGLANGVESLSWQLCVLEPEPSVGIEPSSPTDLISENLDPKFADLFPARTIPNH